MRLALWQVILAVVMIITISVIDVVVSHYSHYNCDASRIPHPYRLSLQNRIDLTIKSPQRGVAQYSFDFRSVLAVLAVLLFYLLSLPLQNVIVQCSRAESAHREIIIIFKIIVRVASVLQPTLAVNYATSLRVRCGAQWQLPESHPRMSTHGCGLRVKSCPQPRRQGG